MLIYVNLIIYGTSLGIFGFTPSNLSMAPWHHGISFVRPRDTATMRPVSAGATGLGSGYG